MGSRWSRRVVPAAAVVLAALLVTAWWVARPARTAGGTPVAGGTPTPTATLAPSPAPATAGGLRVLQLPTPGSGRPREVLVYRPPGVPDSARLPVLYLLHGYPGNPDAFFDSLALPAALARFTRAGGTPFVVVLPEGDGDTHPDSEWADAVDGTDLIESFVVSVVIPAVEGRDRRDAAHRAIAGFSMGGYGAMNLALRHRDLFGQVVSLAGYFTIDDPDGVFGNRAATLAANRPDRNIAAARGLRIMLSDGTDDDEPVVRGETQRFAALLAAAGIPTTVRMIPGAHHDTAYVQGELPAVEAFLGAGWAG